MERRASRSLTGLSEAAGSSGPQPSRSLAGLVPLLASQDTLVPEEERAYRAVQRQHTFSDGDCTDSSLSPSSRPFLSAVQSPVSSLPATVSLSEFEDANSILVSPDTPDRETGQSLHQPKEKRTHMRKFSDFDTDLPPLELFYGPHLHFAEGFTETPDENDLFPSTPLDEEQMKHADSRLKEELGDVIINEQMEVIEEELQWSDIPWMDPRWLDPRPAMYNAADHAEVFALNVWHKFQGYKVMIYTGVFSRRCPGCCFRQPAAVAAG
jgi:hypothetical protein